MGPTASSALRFGVLLIQIGRYRLVPMVSGYDTFIRISQLVLFASLETPVLLCQSRFPLTSDFRFLFLSYRSNRECPIYHPKQPPHATDG
ncbi:hypothetical protein PAXRUDRAFT_829072 [Paxillus rubicundulus Ve08.2h10]|uniref:Uncharacterized protein n=1 Tax=Paxillus rubicundulus Ve08.2h10 TaxID=930991 RepID=A0A0D0D8N3_9AGAM|nr:hypothetical protein PAXRUDRAFT_829072 [Paxillus rubicundulus Ve08.2h10]